MSWEFWWFLYFCFEVFSRIWSEQDLNQTVRTTELQGPLLILETAIFSTRRTTHWKFPQKLLAACGGLHLQVTFGLFWFDENSFVVKSYQTHTVSIFISIKLYQLLVLINIFYSQYSAKRMLKWTSIKYIMIMLHSFLELPLIQEAHFIMCYFLDWTEYVTHRK